MFPLMLNSTPTRPKRLHSFLCHARDVARLGILTTLLFLAPTVAFAQLRPLVSDMLQNLNALDRITEGLALEDWDQVEDASRGLRTRAIRMRLLDLETLHMDRNQDPVWDAFLIAQEQAAREVSLAVRNQDTDGAIAATRNLSRNACLACHAVFRDPQNRLRDSVVYMTTFLSSWRDMNRGLMIRDFDLIKRRATEIAALTEIIGTDETLEDAFSLGGPRQRRIFRSFLAAVASNANSMKSAAETKDVSKILNGSSAMLKDGCFACHAKFRH